MFEQQGSQDVGSVLGFDLVRNNHLLHHLVSDSRQSLLVQVQQHRTCTHTSTHTQTRDSAQEVAPAGRSRRSCHIPCEMVLRSSSRLRKESEATWGFPQRSVSSSTSSSNLIQRAVSFHCISWFLSMVSSFSSTNTCQQGRVRGSEAATASQPQAGRQAGRTTVAVTHLQTHAADFVSNRLIHSKSLSTRLIFECQTYKVNDREEIFFWGRKRCQILRF